MNNDKIELSIELVEKIMSYLINQPWREVNGLIIQIGSEMNKKE